jgi:hypothetical protein
MAESSVSSTSQSSSLLARKTCARTGWAAQLIAEVSSWLTAMVDKVKIAVLPVVTVLSTEY